MKFGQISSNEKRIELVACKFNFSTNITPISELEICPLPIAGDQCRGKL